MNPSQRTSLVLVAGLAAVLALAGAQAAAGTLIAESQAEFPFGDDSAPKQGTSSWFYGYHDFTANGAYQATPGGTDKFIAFPDNQAPGTSPTDFWTGSAWDWYPGNPPWSFIGQTDIHPNGDSNTAEHWVMRRYVVEADEVGPGKTHLNVEWTLRKMNLAGDGVSGVVFHNGAPVDAATIAGNDGTGVARTVRVPGVKAGDFIDVAHLPVGLNNLDRTDGSDASAMTAMISTADPIARGDVVADSVADFSGVQGARSWRYGYYNRTADADGTYQSSDFTEFLGGVDKPGSWGTGANEFTGANWDLAQPNGPWTVLTPAGGHPNGTNTGDEHWAIRRWQSTVDGAVNMEFQNRKTNLAPATTGTTARLFVNGVENGAIPVEGGDGVGRTWTVHVADLKKGDLVDLALDPRGDDGSDGSAFSAKVHFVCPLPTVLVADSTADFPALDDTSANSKQGINNWTYGYHNVTQDGADGYQASDFIAFPDNQGPGTSSADFWTGSAWNWHAGDPPWTEIGAAFGHPNTGGDDDDHWAIRRWEADADGDLVVETFFAKDNLGGGDGIVGRLFHNGVELYSQAVAFDDGVGFRSVTTIPGVQQGDFIDLVLDYGGDDGSDGSLFSAQIYRVGEPVDIIPEPVTLVTVAMGLLCLHRPLRRRRSRRTARE